MAWDLACVWSPSPHVQPRVKLENMRRFGVITMPKQSNIFFFFFATSRGCSVWSDRPFTIIIVTCSRVLGSTRVVNSILSSECRCVCTWVIPVGEE